MRKQLSSPLDALADEFSTTLVREGGVAPNGARRAFSPKTAAEYGRIVRMFSRTMNLLGDLTETTARLQQWRKQVQRQLEQRKITESKIRNDIHALRSFYTWLEGKQRYVGNPARLVMSTPPRRWKPRPSALATVQELLSSINPMNADGSINEVTLRDRAMIELAYNGFRREEICRTNQDEVQYAVLQDGTHTLTVLAHGKKQKTRLIPLSPNSATFLAVLLLMRHEPADWREWCKEFLEEFGAAAPVRAVQRLHDLRKLEPGPIFLHGVERIDEREFNRVFAKHRDALGIPKEHVPHRLRHTYATQLLNNHVDLRIIQELLGHESIVITQMYTDASIGRKGEAATSLPTSAALQL